jgi:hypothetical protein
VAIELDAYDEMNVARAEWNGGMFSSSDRPKIYPGTIVQESKANIQRVPYIGRDPSQPQPEPVPGLPGHVIITDGQSEGFPSSNANSLEFDK